MKFESTAAEFKTVPASERRRRRKKKHDTGPLRYRTINILIVILQSVSKIKCRFIDFGI